jgi:error-prone DNA polymerase
MVPARAVRVSYVELQVTSNYSFLRGASAAEELIAAAAELGLPAIGITDLNTVAGAVRMHDAAKEGGVRLLPGSRLRFRDTTADILCYPRDRDGWGNLTRLLTLGKTRVEHGDTSEAAKHTNRCFLRHEDLLAHAATHQMIVVPSTRIDNDLRNLTRRMAADFPGRCYVAACRLHRDDDLQRIEALAALGLPLVATNDVLYHLPRRRRLQDVLTCIRLGCRIDEAGFALQANAERYLKSPSEMARLFAAHPEAIDRTLEIADACRFSLDELRYEYPDEPIPEGRTPDDHLAALTWQGAAGRYPGGIPATVMQTVTKELAIIRKLEFARYFITVHDIVHFARSRHILCQGRGSAANSVVCYCLGITEVNPVKTELLFERFVSLERHEPPDIDVDFEHERREEVIQYIYKRYGRDRAGIAATVIHYRPKSAMRDVGKAMGLTQDTITALAAQSWNVGETLWPDDRVAELGLEPDHLAIRQTVQLARELVGFPRHLSQHVGGFVLTRGRLDELVPIGNAAMDQRTFIEWDKDDIDTLGIMKIDVLALGMLTCIRKALELIGIARMQDIPDEDREVYAMLSRGDSIGVFQVESRAQINMLPRLKPQAFYDLVIEVAIVRPGPIQGDMVHPYLRRRQKLETVSFPSPSPEHGDADELERVLGRTLGVPLFQEQAMRIAIEAARFTPEEANRLRRAMATFRNVGTIHSFFTKMVDGMVRRGYDPDFAERCFRQIEGFGTYGFPESHAASFALLVYVSAWLKCHHPACFACALLNSQPMGFYAPAQLVRDAREHGVVVREVDIRHSDWDSTIEADGALRLGFRIVTGFRQDWAERIADGRSRAAALTCLGDLVRMRLPRPALQALAEADALRSLGTGRQIASWLLDAVPDAEPLPLFANAPSDAELGTGNPRLPPISQSEDVLADYRIAGLSLKAHPMRRLRPALAAEGILSCAEATAMADSSKVRVAGVVLVRQRPGEGNVVFCTIEDETGIANIVIWSSQFERFRRALLGSAVLLVTGRLQRSPEDIVHIITERLEDRSAQLVDAPPGLVPGSGPESVDTLAWTDLTIPADELPRPMARRPNLPRSRDFR